MVFKLRTCELADWDGSDNDVTPSSRNLFRQSTRWPKCERKSTPMREYVLSAMTNRHVNSRWQLKLRLRGSL
jgi:hypothetical protein